MGGAAPEFGEGSTLGLRTLVSERYGRRYDLAR